MPIGTGASGVVKQEVEKILNPDCVVTFCPTKKYKGEFGFDWVRIDHQLNTQNGNQNCITPEILGYYLQNSTQGTGFASTDTEGTDCSNCKITCNTVCNKSKSCFDCSPTSSCIICSDINSWSQTFKHDNPSDSSVVTTVHRPPYPNSFFLLIKCHISSILTSSISPLTAGSGSLEALTPCSGSNIIRSNGSL